MPGNRNIIRRVREDHLGLFPGKPKLVGLIFQGTAADKPSVAKLPQVAENGDELTLAEFRHPIVSRVAPPLRVSDLPSDSQLLQL